MATGSKTAAATSDDATTAFFEGLGDRGHEPALGHSSGSISFMVGDGKDAEFWRVDIKKGDVSVSHKRGETDAWVKASRECTDLVVQGRENVITAMLRDIIQVGGDLGLLIQFQKVFPGPPAGFERARLKAKVTR
jgi:hypothetical protein